MVFTHCSTLAFIVLQSKRVLTLHSMYLTYPCFMLVLICLIFCRYCLIMAHIILIGLLWSHFDKLPPYLGCYHVGYYHWRSFFVDLRPLSFYLIMDSYFLLSFCMQALGILVVTLYHKNTVYHWPKRLELAKHVACLHYGFRLAYLVDLYGKFMILVNCLSLGRAWIVQLVASIFCPSINYKIVDLQRTHVFWLL